VHFRLVRQLNRPENHRAGNFAFAEPAWLATGRSRLESAVRIEPVDGPGDAVDQFRFEKGRVVPDLTGRIPRGARVPAGGWPASKYHVRLLLMEAGRPLGDERLSFVIE